MRSPDSVGSAEADLAELVLTCVALDPALDLLRSAGLRIDVIYPADDPHTAILSQGDQRVRLTERPDAPPPSTELPPFSPRLVVTRAGTAANAGRAGMSYRDLIPDRLGGRYVASHITIHQAGPVADWIHFHRVGLQMLAVRSGWVRVVYEDQGDPFVMHSGDIVLQPPGIRHRVLESSAGFEVIEIGCPALHETFADHELELPNCQGEASRLFGGQHFLFHRAEETAWTRFGAAEAQQTAMRAATGGLADVRIIRPRQSHRIEFPQHDGELMFGFVLAGNGRLDVADGHAIGPADAFVIPPDVPWALDAISADFRLLHLTTTNLPATLPAIDRPSHAESA